jgi:hypothetical protein
MTEDIRIWEIVESDNLKEIAKSKLNIESRLEEWIEKDISIISYDLITIGRQIETDFGGIIDLLCLDLEGNIVIIELKKDKTPREVVAQVLDYASWVKDLSNERINEIANEYLGKKGPLESVFKNKFDQDLPEILNENHKMIVVASEIDPSSERIINYLSGNYGVALNAISFQYFKDDSGREYLARTFLIEPSEVDRKSKAKISSKRKPPISFEEFKEIADKNGTGAMFSHISEEITDLFDKRFTTRSTVSWAGVIKSSVHTIINILPLESNEEKGLRFYIYIERLAEYFVTEKEKLLNFLPKDIKEIPPWKGAPIAVFGYFKNMQQIENFLMGLKSLK